MRSVSVVQTTAGLTKYRYTNAGRIKEIITQNGIRTSYDYDEDGNVSRLTIGDGTEEGLLYDAFLLYDLNGNRTGKSGSRFSAAGTREEMAVTYRYDSMNRLTNEDRNGTGERYAYDLCGNRLLKEQYRGSSVDAAEGYRYNERNELTERIKAGTLTTCRYDRNGSIVSEEQEGRKSEYRYDLLNRQTYVKTLDGREQENFYDGEGLRAGMTENGRKTTFLYHNGEILAECDGESAPIRRYLRGIGLSQVQTLDDNVFHSCHQDEQGSTAYITGQGRETENSYQYDAFGNLIERKEAITNRILYTGQQYDQETGQYYLRARYYNPVVGRFLQEDTYRGDGLNLYAYCANNPVMYYDPNGHSIKSWFENLCKKIAEFFGEDTPAGEVVNEPDELIHVYRGTDKYSEISVYYETGQLMSDATRNLYLQSNDLNVAYDQSSHIHEKWLEIWGNENDYVQAHGAFGTELSQAFELDRTFMSVTTDPEVANRFAGTKGQVYEAYIPESQLIKQTLSDAGESEYLIKFGSGGFKCQ